MYFKEKSQNLGTFSLLLFMSPRLFTTGYHCISTHLTKRVFELHYEFISTLLPKINFQRHSRIRRTTEYQFHLQLFLRRFFSTESTVR